VDISFLLSPQPTSIALHLRTLGNAVGEDLPHLKSILGYMWDQMSRAHATSRHSIDMTTQPFRTFVLEVPGALQLFITAGWSIHEKDMVLVYDRHPHEPGQRQLLAIEMLKDEIHSLPTRTHTASFDAELPFVVEEYNTLTRLFESRDLVPSLNTLRRWVYLWSYFRMMCAARPNSASQWEKHLMSCRAYCLHVTDKVRQTYHSVLLPPITLMMDPTPGNTPLKQSHQMDQSAPSPVMYTSPAEALVRTPVFGQDREEFSIAQPAAHLLSRDPSTTHAGLLNMRQCCFMNSLLQTYFMHPTMAEAIMGVPCLNEAEAQHKTNANVRLVHRLQALFAYMEVSRISCINPKYVLDAVAAMHPSFRDGGQHDPQEFASCVIEMVVAGFEALQPSKVGFLQKLLYGECNEQSVGWDKAFSAPRSTPVAHSLPLYFEAGVHGPTQSQHRDPTDLLSVLSTPQATYTLDAALLDYVVEEKEVGCSVACVTKSFSTLPSLLMLHFPSRVAGAGGNKLDIAVAFGESLDLTPYSGAPDAESARTNYVDAYVGERNIQRDLDSAQKSLEQLITAQRGFVGAASEHDFMLNCIVRATKERVERLTEELTAATKARKALFPFPNITSRPECHYHLHAVIVHLGATSEYGHYISYVREGDGSWLRCDDTSVRAVPSSEVFSAYTQRNVYCLLYTTVTEPRKELAVPEYLSEIIQHEDLRKCERIARRLSMYAGDLSEDLDTSGEQEGSLRYGMMKV
jgi:hypothetical protein